MTAALVSIVTPAFNAAKYLPQTIESVLAQSYGDWELLVVDDCSSDDTLRIAEDFAARDTLGRVRALELPRNSGPAVARQAAIEAAQGRYVAFLDSDDLWLPHKLERQLAFMQARGAALSFTAFRRISSDGGTLGRLIRVPDSLTYNQLLGNTAIATSTVIVDRERTGPFRMVKTYYDDFALWLELTRRGFAAFGLDDDLMRYRVLGGSVSRNKGRSAMMVWRTYRNVEKLPFLRSAWCFARYAMNGAMKYRSY